MKSVLIATVLCRAMVSMKMASDLSGLSDKPQSANYSLTFLKQMSRPVPTLVPSIAMYS